MIELTKCLYADHPDLFQKQYSCQNILIQQWDFPAEVHSTHNLGAEYEDRVHEKWCKGMEWLRKQTGENYVDWRTVSRKHLKGFAKIIMGEWLKSLGKNRRVTGVRLIRYTNVSNGSPCKLLQVYSRDPKDPKVKLYSNNHNAPNIKYY